MTSPLDNHPKNPGSLLTRRELALLAAAGLVAACKKEEATLDTSATDTSATDTSATATAIKAAPVATADVHVHLFNANFLPLDGIFAKWVSGTIAGAAAAILLSRVDECPDDASLAAAGTGDPLAEIEDIPPDDLLMRLYEQTDASTFRSNDVEQGLQSVTPEDMGRLSSAPNDATRKTIARDGFVEMFNKTAEGAREVFPERGGFFQWVTLMTWCERKIWRAVTTAYPDVQLFIAHMMDMENYYTPSTPKYDWPDEQLRRMRALMRAADGKLLTFTAFDPKRDNWRSILEQSLAHGCAGAKFYPPNGYPPFDVTTNSIPPRTAEFFRFCIAEDLPIFTHTTTHGFEAMRGFGQRYANPALWRRVLEQSEFRNLRLCFGHAGGEKGWFPESDTASAPVPPPFSAEVVALCREFPNVYCEMAYLSPILKPAGQERFQRALRKAMQGTGAYPIAKKIMYGSDWHMIHKVRDHRAYLPSFRAALGAPEWNDLRADFFLGNAVRWLNLGGYLKRLTTKYPNALTEAAIDHLRTLVPA